MAEVFKPIGTETSVNTTPTTVSTSSKLVSSTKQKSKNSKQMNDYVENIESNI
jgi:hypothetical protein